MASTNLSIRLAVEGAQKGAADLAVVDAQLNLIGSSASRGAAAFVKFNGASSLTHVQKLKSTFQDTGIAINSASSQVEKLVTRMQRVSRERAFQQLASDANLSAIQVARLRMSMGDTRGAVSSLTSALGAAKLAIAAWGAALVYAGNVALEAALQMDRLDKAYTSITGSAQAARGQLSFLQDTADRLGLQFQSTALSAKTFFAAGKGSSLEPQLNAIFEAVSSAGAALSMTQDDIQGAFLALGQMISKGKVQAEELRGQLGERLPGAFQMAARAMNMTTAELDKFMADGKLTAEELLPRLAKVLRDEYGTAAETAAQGMQGAVNRLSTEWELFKAGLIDSDAAVAGINAARGAISSLREAFDTLAAYKDLLKSLLVGAGFAAGAALVGKFGAALLGAEASAALLAGRLGLLIPLLTNPWTLALAAIGATAAGIYYYAQQADAAEQAQQALNNAQREAAEINRELASASKASVDSLEKQMQRAQANMDNLAGKVEGLLAELTKPLPSGNWLDNALGLERSESSLNSYERRLVELRRAAAETADFKQLQESLKDLALEAENDGRMTNVLRKAIEDAQRVASLGIKLKVEMEGFEATWQKISQLIYWRSLMGENATPVTTTDWRERQDAEKQKFLDELETSYKKTTPGKREALLKEQSSLREKMASLPSRGLSSEQMVQAQTQLSALLKKNQDDLDKLDQKGNSAAKAAAIAQANYTGELERTQQQIDSLQQQLDLDRGEDLARAKIRIEQQYHAALSKTRQELDNQVTRGALTRGQAEALRLEKDKAAALQMQVSLRDAENAASEKAIRLAEGQLSFYKELGELGGKYENHLDLQVQLIEEQAKKYEDLKIPPKLLEDWKKLKLLQVSTDPFDGAYRGLLKFNAEFADSGAQWEDITHGFASDFNSATKDMFDDFLDNGRASFDDLGQLFKRLLKDMAYQALIQPVVLSVVNGAAGALYGSTTAGTTGGVAGAGTGMGYAGSVIQLGAQAAQGYATNQLMSGLGGSGGMFGGIANSINSGVAGMFPTLFAPTNTLAAAGSAVNAIPGMAGSMPTTTFTGLLGGAGLAGGLGSLGYGLLGGAIGLPQSQYSGITSGIGSALGYMGGSTLGASLGGTIGSVVPVVGTVIGALAGGLLGSVFGGFGGAEDGPPTYDWHLYQKLWEKGPEEDAPWVFDGYRGSEKGAESDAYHVSSWGKWGIPDELRQQGAEYAYSVMKGVSGQSWALADALGAVSGSMKDEYLRGLEQQGELYHYSRWRGGDISEENLQKSAEAYIKKATEHMANALGNVNLQPLTIAADGMAADTVDELGQSLAQAFSFYDIGETFEDEQVKAKFQAQARKQIVDAFAGLDMSSLRVDFNQSSFAGLQQAYAAVQAWDTVTAGLEAILNPLSELTTQLNTATTQFDGWIANLRALGWQEEAIAEIEQQRAQYLHEYATAVTRAGEQDLALRTLALEYGSDSDVYGIRSLQYQQENELAQLAARYGKDSGLYSTAVEVQQAELAQLALDQMIKKRDQLVQEEIQSQNRLVSALGNLADSLDAARRSLWTGQDNLLGTRLSDARAEFDALYDRAMSGDRDALSQLSGMGTTLLQLGRDSLSTSGEYTDLFYDVDQKLKKAQEYAAGQVSESQAMLDALNAQITQGEASQMTLEEINAQIVALQAVFEKEKADITGGGSLSQREALLRAKANQLNAQAYMGRTDWTPDSTLSEIYRQNLTLETWYDKWGRYEGLGVEYDTDAARQAILANKVIQSNANDKTDTWTPQGILDEINRQGMTFDQWFLRYGLGEGISAGGKDYSGHAQAVFYDYDALLRDKAADLSAEGYLGNTRWTAQEVAAEIANQGMTVQQWYELYGQQEGYALRAAKTTNNAIDDSTAALDATLNAQLEAALGTGSSISGLLMTQSTGWAGLFGKMDSLSSALTKIAQQAALGGDLSGGSSSGSGTGIYGSKYSSVGALLEAKARQTSASGATEANGVRVPSGNWTANDIARAISNGGMTVQQWYERYGKAEGFASGGVTPADEVFWVGENGPELMMSPRRWGVLSNPDSMSLLDSLTASPLSSGPTPMGLDTPYSPAVAPVAAPVMFGGGQPDNREILAELREIKGYLRQTVVKTDKAAYCADKINGLMRMWNAEGLPARAAA